MSIIAAILLAAAPPTTKCFHDCKTSDTGIALIQHFEGYSPFPYDDVIGVSTVGWGHVILDSDNLDYPLMPDEAETLLRNDLVKAERSVNQSVHIPLANCRFDALTSLSYNIGASNFQKSTLLRRVNEQRHNEVRAQFLRWVNAGGKMIKGLVRRREGEADMYDKGDM